MSLLSLPFQSISWGAFQADRRLRVKNWKQLLTSVYRSFFFLFHPPVLVPMGAVRIRHNRKRGSASYYCAWGTFGEREREREREIGDEFTLPLPKILTIGDELTLSLAKNWHFSFLPSHFPSLPSRRGHHCGAEIRNEFTLSIAKKIFALFVPPLSNGTSRATSDRKPKTNDQILPSPILFFPSKKWIKLMPKTIGSRKKDCAWGGSGWKTLPEKIYRLQSTNQEGVRSV